MCIFSWQRSRFVFIAYWQFNITSTSSPKVCSDFNGQRWKFYFPESFLHMILSQSQSMEGLTHDLEARRERETIILWRQLQMSGSTQLPVRLLESIHVSDPHWDRLWKFLKLCNYSCKLPEQPLWMQTGNTGDGYADLGQDNWAKL